MNRSRKAGRKKETNKQTKVKFSLEQVVNVQRGVQV
jgi:hypothetical protein